MDSNSSDDNSSSKDAAKLKKISLLRKEVTTHIQNFLWSARREGDNKPLAFSYRQRKRKCHGRDIKHYITQCACVCFVYYYYY